MEITYHKGFIVIKSGKPGPVFVAPHHTLSYTRSEREDVGSENVAFTGVQKLGGSAVISAVPRLGIVGIDYNRAAPSIKKVKKSMNTRTSDSSLDYFKTFAWVTDNENQFNTKKKVYKDFWKTVTDLGKETEKPLFIFCHALCSRLKNLPAVIDVITGRGKWIDIGRVEAVVTELNQKYDLDKYRDDIKEHMYFWLLLYKNYIKQNFSSLAATEGMVREWLDADMANVKNILGEDIAVSELTFDKYKELIDKMFDKIKLQVSVESIYHGDYAKPVAPLLKKTGGVAFEVESASYLNEIHPDIVVDIIKDIIEGS